MCFLFSSFLRLPLHLFPASPFRRFTHSPIHPFTASPVHRRCGFTLVEVLVALAVVSGIFLLVLSSFSFHIGVVDRTKDDLRLVLAAKENIYRFKSGEAREGEETRDGIVHVLRTEDAEFGLKKVVSSAATDKEKVTVFEYVKR